jgi:hypothetical protein
MPGRPSNRHPDHTVVVYGAMYTTVYRLDYVAMTSSTLRQPHHNVGASPSSAASTERHGPSPIAQHRRNATERSRRVRSPSPRITLRPPPQRIRATSNVMALVSDHHIASRRIRAADLHAERHVELGQPDVGRAQWHGQPAGQCVAVGPHANSAARAGDVEPATAMCPDRAGEEIAVVGPGALDHLVIETPAFVGMPRGINP